MKWSVPLAFIIDINCHIKPYHAGILLFIVCVEEAWSNGFENQMITFTSIKTITAKKFRIIFRLSTYLLHISLKC